MKIFIGNIILAGGVEAHESPYDFGIFNERDTQIVSTLRGVVARGYDRGNQVTTIEFKVARRHGSIEDAQKFMLMHVSGLNNLATYLTIIEEPSGDIFYLHGAVICSVRGASSGNATTHTYRVMGGNFSTSIN